MNLVQKLLFACALILFCHSGFAVTLQHALNSYYSGNFSEAISQLQALTRQNQGQGQAYYYLGKIYARGDGVNANVGRALAYFRKANEYGVDGAATQLASLNNGNDSTKLTWFLENAWQGDVQSQYELAQMFEFGTGTQTDTRRAFNWYLEAAQKNHADAQLRLALMFIVGAGVERDMIAAREWLISCTDLGSPVAPKLLEFFSSNLTDKEKLRITRGLRAIEYADDSQLISQLETSIKQIDRSQADKGFENREFSLTELTVGDDGAVIDVAVETSSAMEAPKPISDEFQVQENQQQERRFIIAGLVTCLLILLYLTIKPLLTRRIAAAALNTPLAHNKGNEEYKEEKTPLPVPKVSSSEETKPKGPDLTETAESLAPVQSKEAVNEAGKAVLSHSNDDIAVSKSVVTISYQALVPNQLIELSYSGLQSRPVETTLVRQIHASEESGEQFLPEEKISVMNRSARRHRVANRVLEKDVTLSLAETRYNIAMMFMRGDGVPANFKLAEKWLRQSAELGYFKAQAELSKLLSPQTLEPTMHPVVAAESFMEYRNIGAA